MTQDWTEEFLYQFAQQKRVSNDELSTLELALRGKTAEAIARSQGISAAAVRKRLSSVYTKFAIEGAGPGKLETLRHTLQTQYQTSALMPRTHQPDWGEAISASSFHGRETERQTLARWLRQDECRLIVLTGMGGMGKTTLAVKFAMEHQTQYQVIWRSLREAPRLNKLLQDVLNVLSHQAIAPLSDSQEDNITQLLSHLAQHPCLLILDNAESLFVSQKKTGNYRPGYEGYGELFRRIGETQHKSCLVLTSREKPAEVATLESSTLYTRTMELQGSLETSQAILASKGLTGSPHHQQKLITFYNGNPLALKIVATTINELFDGDIEEFLKQNQPQEVNGLPIVGSMRRLLDSQFERLSPLEQTLMNWLTINREPIPLRILKEDLVPTVPLNQVVEALENLRARCLVRTAKPSRMGNHAKGVTLQGFVMEYMTNRLVERIGQELKQGQFHDFHAYALMKASAKEHIRASQKQLILEPIARALLAWMTPNEIEVWATETLNQLRQQRMAIASLPSLPLLSRAAPSYAAGNLLNLLLHLHIDVTRYDFSHLAVWQADLREARLHNVNFTGADLAKSAFTEVVGDVLAVAYSPKGDLLATTDSDGQLHLWATKDGVKQHTCDCRSGWVRTVAFSPEQDVVVTGDDRNVKVWDVETGQLKQALRQHQDWVRSVCFVLSGRVLASGSDDQTIKLWDRTTDNQLPPLEAHTSRIKAIACNATREILASGGDDGVIHLWAFSINAEGNVQCQPLPPINVNQQVRFLTFHPTEPHILASSSDDRSIRLWDIERGFCLKAFSPTEDWVRSLSFSPDGRYLASGGDDTQICIWDVATGTCTKKLFGHRSRIWSVAFSPDGQTLASGSDNQTIKFWDVARERCLKTLQGYTRGIRTVAFHPHEPWLVSGGDDRVVRLWALPLAESRRETTTPVHDGARSPQDPVRSAEMGAIASHAGAITADPGETIKSSAMPMSPTPLANPESSCLKRFEGHEGRVWSVAIHPNGEWIASGSDDKTIRLWNIKTEQGWKLKGHQDWIRSVAFGHHPQTQTVILASGSDDGMIKLWDVTTGQCLDTLKQHTDWVRAVAFSPNADLSLLASGSDDQTVGTGDSTIKLWNLETDCCYNMQGESASGVRALAFSPDGKLLASGSDDRTVRLWSIEQSYCLMHFPHHGGRVWSVAFSPDGRTVASGSDDKTVRLWDVETGNIVQTLEGHKQRIRAVSFSPDGTLLATGSQDGNIRLWDTHFYQCIHRLRTLRPYSKTCIKDATNLTPAQKLAMIELGAIQD